MNAFVVEFRLKIIDSIRWFAKGLHLEANSFNFTKDSTFSSRLHILLIVKSITNVYAINIIVKY